MVLRDEKRSCIQSLHFEVMVNTPSNDSARFVKDLADWSVEDKMYVYKGVNTPMDHKIVWNIIL